jgi:hypothetical protein
MLAYCLPIDLNGGFMTRLVKNKIAAAALISSLVSVAAAPSANPQTVRRTT